MDDPNAGDLNLFGDPWTPPKDPRGRKRHRRLAQIAEKIAVLVATGSTIEEIAARIGLSVPTLKKYYFRELEQGAELARQVLVETMWGKALAGNVGAARFIKEELARGDSSAFLRRAQQPGKAEPGSAGAPSARLGKKEAAVVAAKGAGKDTVWGDDLAFKH